MAILSNQCPVRWQNLHNGQSIALQSDQEQITYAQLDAKLCDLAEQLTPQIKQNKTALPIRLICISTNSVELVLIQLLCIRMGWLFCPLNPRFTENEIKQRLTILNSDYCWVSDELENSSFHHQFNTLKIDFKVTVQCNTQPLSLISINPMCPCSIIFTSGSSGFPKAITHHYQQHFFSALGSHSLIPLINDDHNLLSLPLFHVGGYATVIRSIIAGACIHLTQAPLDLSLLQYRAITHLSLVSTQLIRLLTDDNFTANRCAIKHVLLGGSAFPPHLLAALENRNFTYHLSYGCTEMGSQVATSTNNSDLNILPYRQVKVVNGDILLRGETRCIGYFDTDKINELETTKWINIGDTGLLEGTKLIVSGRKDRQFISGGENIKPEEIELVCLQHRSVKQVYIAPIKHIEYGQSIALFVSFHVNNKETFEQQTKQLKQYLKTQLTGYKQPDTYLAWPEPSANNQALKISKKVFQTILKKQGLI